jgi:penicillin-binding protein 1C
VLGALILVLLVLRLTPKAPILDAQPWSNAVYASGGELLRLSLASDQQYRLWTPLGRLAPDYVEAVLLYEDRGFYWHPGVNPYALLRSAYATAFGQRRQGGSTITMQLARRLYHIESRTVSGKLKQIAAALWLELRYGKAEILEAYLNLTPFGGNIEGAGAASLIYFRKPAAVLNLPESIALAVIPQNPQQRLVSGAENTALREARARLWQSWLHRHAGDGRLAADQQLALQTFTRNDLPFEAPHAVDMLLHTAWKAANGPPSAEVRTTLDLRLQHLLERVITEYLRVRTESGVTNACALLLDAQTMQVKAMVGSAGYFDEAIAGQVNGAAAKRSPGSTLKPFIYALALDQGVLHPMSILKDAPTSFGPFSPENYDGRFAGPITAQDALIRSRNIPAVAVAAKLGKPDLYDFLKMAGVGKMQSPEHYGLALVLGGGEVSMEELAQMYAVLANGGVWRPLAYVQGLEEGRGTRLLSEESAFIAVDMLRQNIRPDTLAPARPAVAWKTGTSWSFRDAWTAGIFGRYVLVVWLGNFDGRSNPALVGIEAAAPLFLRIVDAIRAEHLDPGEVARKPPAELRRVEVCAASGDLPDELCTVRTSTWFIAGKSPIKRSKLHRTVWVDRLSGKPSCSPSANATPTVFESWSSDIQQVFTEAGLPRRALPGAECGNANPEAGGPKIASPLRSVRYTFRLSKPEPLMLRAEAPGEVKTLFWFVDNELVGRSKPGETLLWKPASPRSYLVRVVDDGGRADSRDLDVAFVP